MTDQINTHQLIDYDLCGRPVKTSTGYSLVEMSVTDGMSVDKSGLTHGGFIFGLADHAAMIAVNHPNVVLGAAEVKFIKPTKTGDTLIAEATITEDEGRKKMVTVSVTKQDDSVFEGRFTCYVLDKHVLD